MARNNKAVVFAFNSLRTLNKLVCWENQCSFLPLNKAAVLLKKLNPWAAAEERFGFHSSHGHCNPEASLNNHGQYPSSSGSGSGFGVSSESYVDHGQRRDTDVVVKPITMNTLRRQSKYDNYVAARSYGEIEGMVFLEAESDEFALLVFDARCMEGNIDEAMDSLNLLLEVGVFVDLPRYLNLMKICKGNKYLQVAKEIHEHLEESFSPLRVSTYNKILEMYARCGSMADACSVFFREESLGCNLSSWDTMIRGYARNGLGEEAIDMFTRFKDQGRRPDGPMFLEIFDVCADLGDAIEGMLHFESMSKLYGIVPTLEHYESIVDMLGTLGHLDEALELIERMPIEPTIDIFEILINLCRVHGNSELGDRCVEIVKELDSSRLTDEMKTGLVPMDDKDYMQHLWNEKESRAIYVRG